jgi:hypothetical protein
VSVGAVAGGQAVYGVLCLLLVFSKSLRPAAIADLRTGSSLSFGIRRYNGRGGDTIITVDILRSLRRVVGLAVVRRYS